MIDKKSTGRFFGVILAATFGSLIAETIRLWLGLHLAATLLVFIGLWIGFYFTGTWTIIDRPAELDRKFPISSKELRRRKKEFYDWVDSLGRR
ncbi:MAG TPA: hypothetical protein VN948_10855 [Terriglobales bacterium]|nr:hypothetical protein [Terriglobales bacterium]